MVFKNTLWLGMAQIATVLLSPLLTILLARRGSATLLGQYAVAMSYVGIFSILTDLGMSGVVIRDIAYDQSRAESYTARSIPLRLSVSVLGVVLLNAVLWWGKYSGTDRVVIGAFGVGMFFVSIAELFRAVFRGSQRMEYDAIARVCERVLVVGLSGLVLIGGRGTALGLGVTYAVAQFVVLALMAWMTGRAFFRLTVRFDSSFVKKILTSSLLFFLAGFFWQLYTRADRIILERTTSATDVGWYAAAYSFLPLVGLAPALIVQVLYPAISRAYSRSDPQLSRLIERLFLYLLGIAVPIASVLVVLARPVITLFYGYEFLPASPVLQVLALTIVFTFASQLFTNVLPAIGMEKLWVATLALGAVTNLIANLLLIPAYGAKGAAVTIVITEAIVSLFMLALVRRRLKVPFARPVLIVGVAFGSATVLYWVLRHWLGTWGVWPACVGYAVLLILLDGKILSDLRDLARSLGLWTTAPESAG